MVHDNSTEMNATDNEGKSVVAERFIGLHQTEEC